MGREENEKWHITFKFSSPTSKEIWVSLVQLFSPYFSQLYPFSHFPFFFFLLFSRTHKTELVYSIQPWFLLTKAQKAILSTFVIGLAPQNNLVSLINIICHPKSSQNLFWRYLFFSITKCFCIDLLWYVVEVLFCFVVFLVELYEEKSSLTHM